ncbi:MAG: hypothetical protein K0S32_2596 [Bacteroidetes bacterium]|jgi:hypothetical protein|nr:hypothetical protein [Bacteroidota bacterium]
MRVKLLAARLSIGCRSDSEKVHKINNWITRRIKYDVKGFISHRTTMWSLKKTLRKRKGLCREYSALFDALCKQNNIPSLTIRGYAKSFFVDEADIFFTDDHCWNTFKADGKWYLNDATWASGGLVIKYSPFYYYQYRLKLRRFPYKIKFFRDYNPIYLFSDGPNFALDHFPVKKNYQLLKEKMEIEDFENLTFYKDTIRNYLERNKTNGTQNDDYLEIITQENELTRNYSESKDHLGENPRNTFSFLKYFVEYDNVNAKEDASDTIFIKEEIQRYSDIQPFVNCTRENIILDYNINFKQVNHKKTLFKAGYFSPVKSALRQNQKSIRTNRYYLKKSNYFLNVNQFKYFFRYKSLLLLRIVRPVANLHQTKRERKKLARFKERKEAAKRNAINKRNDMIAILKGIDQRDSISRDLFKRAIDNYIVNYEKFKTINSWRKGFMDCYDIGVIPMQDSIISTAKLVTSYLNLNEPEIKGAYGQYKRYIKCHKEFVNNMKKYRVNIIKCTNYDVTLQPYHIELHAADSIINNTYSSLAKEASERRGFIRNSLDSNSILKHYKNDCKKLVYEEDYFSFCKSLLEKHEVRASRNVRKVQLKIDSKYIRTKLKVLNKQLKTDRRKAQRKKGMKAPK